VRRAAAAPLLLGARRPPLSIDLSCLRGAQQQTRRTLLQRSIDETDRQTDGQRTADRCIDPVPHAMRAVSKVEKSLQKRQKLIQRLDVVMSEQLHVFETRRRRIPCVSSGRRR